VPRAVATCGTALTEDHVRLLKRYASRVVLAFDADAAGQGAADRFYEWEEKYKVEVSVARFPDGRDPGDLASADPDALRQAVEKAEPFLGFRVHRVLAGRPPASPEARARLANQAMALINEHPDDNVRRLYAGEVASHTGLSPADLVRIANQKGGRVVAREDPVRRPLADVLVSIREKCTIAEAGYALEANAERHLKPGAEMARLFAAYPQAVARTLEIAGRVRFSLDDLRYEYPEEPVPTAKAPQAHLEDLTWAHAQERFPDGIPGQVRAVLEKELALIAKLDYARYFLTVYDIVRFARHEAKPPILCQGRGSAANSAVCYCLGITSVDPTRIDLLFERFISADRGEPPDIDVDFEHERREEVIQYLYARYGRDRAAICSTVIHYRSRMAIREVGKALGLKEDVTAALAGLVWGIGDDDF